MSATPKDLRELVQLAQDGDAAGRCRSRPCRRSQANDALMRLRDGR